MRSVSREGLDGGRDAAPNYKRLRTLTSIFSVELPGFEPAALPGLYPSELPVRSRSIPAVSVAGLDGVKSGRLPHRPGEPLRTPTVAWLEFSGAARPCCYQML